MQEFKKRQNDNAEAQRTQRSAEGEEPKTQAQTPCLGQPVEEEKKDGNTEFTEVGAQRSQRKAREERRREMQERFLNAPASGGFGMTGLAGRTL